MHMKGTIIKVEENGLVIRLENCIVSFCPIYECSHEFITQKTIRTKFLVGQEVEVVILPPEDGWEYCSIKRAEVSPKEFILSAFPVGSTVQSKVKRVSPKLIFVQISNEVTGVFSNTPEIPVLSKNDDIFVRIESISRKGMLNCTFISQ